MTWNVHGFRAGPKAVARALSGEPPDLAFLNEAAPKRALRRFAATLGGEATSGLRWRGGIPNAVVARPPWRVLETRVVPLTRTGKLIPRGTVLALIGRAGMRLWAGSVHLGLSDREREGHARELTDLLAGLQAPVVLGGDLNEGPDGPAAGWLAERLWDAFGQGGRGAEGGEEGHTFPAEEPRARIDYLFLGAGLRAERVWVDASQAVRAASDHLPVFADVAIEGEA
jgi:endonuclease/exonuclease/phosphatase family metal-dependent hydrolase